MRKVLMLAYHFPPNGGSGVQRSSKFAKYLPKYDWLPVVIGAKPITAISQDVTLLADLPPGLEVHRIPPVEPLLLRRFTRKTLRPDLFDERPVSFTGGTAKATFYSLLKKIKSRISVVLIPDEQALWALSAASLGFLLALRHSFDAIYSSGSPFSSHLGAVLLGRALHKPVVIDFRDPWTKHRHYPHRGRRENVDHIFEKYLLRQADMVVCNHETMARDFRAMVPGVDPRKFVVITNGYDEADFDDGLQPVAREADRYHIAHTGLVYPGIGLPFLKGLRLLQERDAELAGRVKVRFVGGLPFPDEELTYLKAEKLGGLVEVTPRVSHRESLREMLSADALLLLLASGNGRSAYPGKLYEYLRVGKTILGVIPCEGSATELIRLCGQGIVVDPEDPAAIARALENLIQRNGIADHRGLDLSFAQRFNREELTRRLTRVLEAACGEVTLSAEDMSNVSLGEV